MAFEDRKGKARERRKTMSYLKSSSGEFSSVLQTVLRELLSFNLGEKITRKNITGQAQCYRFGTVWILLKDESLWLITELQTAKLWKKLFLNWADLLQLLSEGPCEAGGSQEGNDPYKIQEQRRTAVCFQFQCSLLVIESN